MSHSPSIRNLTGHQHQILNDYSSNPYARPQVITNASINHRATKPAPRTPSPPTLPMPANPSLDREIENRKRAGWLHLLEARKARLHAVQSGSSAEMLEPLFGLRRELMARDVVGREVLRQIDLIDVGIENVVERYKMEEAARALVHMSRTRTCCACEEEIRNSGDARRR